MQRCLHLAALGRGKVAPNPMVGCVIVSDGEIVGEGYHQQYGQAHAEVNAVNSVVKPELLAGSTVYVSLEPCSHFGKTPPCATLLVDHKVGKVVIGCKDPNRLVEGKGIAILKNAGIEVETGILEHACRELNKWFITFHEKGRPYIILKWAETKDGFMAGKQKQISGKMAQTFLHQWRAEEAAIMVGTNTLLEDDPALNVRYWQGNDPIRIAVDMDLRSVKHHEGQPLKFYDQTQPTIILNGMKDEQAGTLEFIKIKDREPDEILKALYNKNIQSLIIEGGPALLDTFIKKGFYDEIRVFRAKDLLFEKGLAAPIFDAEETGVQDMDTDTLTIYKPR